LLAILTGDLQDQLVLTRRDHFGFERHGLFEPADAITGDAPLRHAIGLEARVHQQRAIRQEHHDGAQGNAAVGRAPDATHESRIDGIVALGRGRRRWRLRSGWLRRRL
jgi:hypothetical protein